MVDFKRQITDLLYKVKLTRSIITGTVRDFKKLRLEEAN